MKSRSPKIKKLRSLLNNAQNRFLDGESETRVKRKKVPFCISGVSYRKLLIINAGLWQFIII